MLNIWNKYTNFAHNPLDSYLNKEGELNILEYKEKNKTQDKADNDEYKNTIFYPSNKE